MAALNTELVVTIEPEAKEAFDRLSAALERLAAALEQQLLVRAPVEEKPAPRKKFIGDTE